MELEGGGGHENILMSNIMVKKGSFGMVFIIYRVWNHISIVYGEVILKKTTKEYRPSLWRLFH